MTELYTRRGLSHWTLNDQPRVGDHRWWISDLRPFRADYPEWRVEHDVESILGEIYVANVERWAQVLAA